MQGFEPWLGFLGFCSLVGHLALAVPVVSLTVFTTFKLFTEQIEKLHVTIFYYAWNTETGGALLTGFKITVGLALVLHSIFCLKAHNV